MNNRLLEVCGITADAVDEPAEASVARDDRTWGPLDHLPGGGPNRDQRSRHVPSWCIDRPLSKGVPHETKDQVTDREGNHVAVHLWVYGAVTRGEG
jgi:hypothetical protein